MCLMHLATLTPSRMTAMPNSHVFGGRAVGGSSRIAPVNIESSPREESRPAASAGHSTFRDARHRTMAFHA
jgi:hypothetical protein